MAVARPVLCLCRFDGLPDIEYADWPRSAIQQSVRIFQDAAPIAPQPVTPQAPSAQVLAPQPITPALGTGAQTPEAPAVLETELSLETSARSSQEAEPKRKAVNVAMLLPLSGDRASVGQDMLDAAQMAVFDIAGNDFNLKVYDTQGTPEGAEDAAKLAVADRARIVLGPLYGRSAAAIRSIISAAGINAVVFSNDRTVAGSPVHLMGLMPEQQIERVIRFAAQRGYRRIGLLLPHGEYGDLVLKSARASAIASGAEITRIAYYDALASDFTETARSFAEYKNRRAA